MKQVMATDLVRMLQDAVTEWGDRPVNVVTASEVERVFYLEPDKFDDDQGDCINIVGWDEEDD